MSTVTSSDADFRIGQISFDALLEIQAEAEERLWGTRWSSVEELRSQVRQAPVILYPLMREMRHGTIRAYRCFVVFSAVNSEDAGGVVTVDIDPVRYESLERLDRDPDVRRIFGRMVMLAVGGISMLPKE
jgi:hypothetical protein